MQTRDVKKILKMCAEEGQAQKCVYLCDWEEKLMIGNLLLKITVAEIC